MASRRPEDLLPLTALSTAILLALADEPLHGYALINTLERETDGRIVPAAGTLYAALQRMLDEGVIAELPPSRERDSRRRSYTLTAFGRAVAAAELARLRQVVSLGSARRLVPAIRSAR